MPPPNGPDKEDVECAWSHKWGCKCRNKTMLIKFEEEFDILIPETSVLGITGIKKDIKSFIASLLQKQEEETREEILECFEKWQTQGRSEEQIYGVKNFLSGEIQILK